MKKARQSDELGAAALQSQHDQATLLRPNHRRRPAAPASGGAVRRKLSGDSVARWRYLGADGQRQPLGNRVLPARVRVCSDVDILALGTDRPATEAERVGRPVTLTIHANDPSTHNVIDLPTG
jgi:hypothetical protein